MGEYMIPSSTNAPNEWKQHWPMVLAAMIGLSYISLFSYSQQMFIEPLEKEFGWPRAQISLGYTILAFTGFLLGPIVGWIVDRKGSRIVALPSSLLAALAFAALGFSSGSLWQWYAMWLCLALAALGLKGTVWSAAVSGTFTKGRGLALALMLCGSAIAQFLAPLVTFELVNDHGWRMAYHYLGLGWGGITFILILFFFRTAKKKNNTSSHQATNPAPYLPGLTFKEAIKSSVILRIYAANLVFSLAGAGISFHLKPILSSTGISSGEAAQLAAIAGIGGVVGKLFTGWLLDRFQGNLIPFFSFALSAFAYFLLLNTFQSSIAVACGVLLLGYTSGAGLGVTTYLISRYAGLRSFGAVYGTLGSMLMLGSGIAPPLAGLVYDITGSYTALLTAAIPVALVFSLLFVGLGPYPNFTSPEENLE